MRLRFWERDVSLTFDEYLTMKFQAMTYGLTGQQTVEGREEEIGGDFRSLVQLAYRRNGVVFACMTARMLLFAEGRFAFQRQRNGQAVDIFTTEALQPLQVPRPNETTGDLLARMIQDADLSGQYIGARQGPYVKRLRPDWTTLVVGSLSDPDVERGDPEAELIGVVYHPGGQHSGRDPVAFLRNEIAYFAPIPDPEAEYRGMSWLEPVIREIMGDKAATEHKLRYFERGGPKEAWVFDKEKTTPEDFKAFVKKAERREDTREAYKTLYLLAAAKPEIVGSHLRQEDFKQVQGAGETRIAAAARTPPVIVGLSEGLQGSSLNQGNYGAARRQFADLVMRPLWRIAAGALSAIVRVPAGAELIHDDRHVSALQEDVGDRAKIQQSQAATITQYVREGFTAKSAIAAVIADDLSLLVHSGLTSVQLQEPGAKDSTEPEGDAASTNGSGDAERVPAPAGRE